MHIRTVSTVRRLNRPVMGLRGLGDDSGDDPFDPTTIDTSTITDPFAGSTIMTGPIATATGDTGSAGFGPGGLFTADQINTIEAGQVPSGLTPAQLSALSSVSTPVGTLPATQNTATLTAAGFNPSQIASILTASAQTAIASYKALQTPGLIPGTNLVYNPATGQITNAAGAIISATGSSLSLSGLSPILIIAAIGAVILIGSKH